MANWMRRYWIFFYETYPSSLFMRIKRSAVFLAKFIMSLSKMESLATNHSHSARNIINSERICMKTFCSILSVQTFTRIRIPATNTRENCEYIEEKRHMIIFDYRCCFNITKHTGERVAQSHRKNQLLTSRFPGKFRYVFPARSNIIYSRICADARVCVNGARIYSRGGLSEFNDLHNVKHR